MSQQIETFDRLIDWNSSITQRDEFLDRVHSTDQLRIKFGADITASTLHIGHGVNLRVMREMQDLGHKVVFLLGGFTTLVGDPTDKLQARSTPELTNLEADKEAFISQVGTILKMDDPEFIEVRDNTEWWGGVEQQGSISQLDFFRLLGDVTLNQLLSRDMFRQRQKEGKPIQMSEFLYPILQGYDSVAMKSDATIVGSDQLFNESMGRFFQERTGQDKQMVICTQITPGLDGGPKQSKSIGNYVGISHSPTEKFDRIMKLRDELTAEWLEVYSTFTLAEIEHMQAKFGNDKLALKKHLARNVTAMFHGEDIAKEAENEFSRKMQRRLPSQIAEVQAGDAASIKSILHSIGYKSGDIKQFIECGSLVSVEVANQEGEYTNNRLSLEQISAVINGDTIIRIGKNKFIKIIAPTKTQSITIS